MKKGNVIVLAGCLLAFYMAIIMYVFFAVLHIGIFLNFETALVFEIMGFLFLSYFILSNLLSKRIKTGFFVPLIGVNIVYTIILNIINMVCVITMPHAVFLLLNLVLLFIYCLVSIPMYVMGKK